MPPLDKRDSNKPPAEIEAEPFRDYQPEGRKGEPLFAPGGVMFLVGFVLLTLLGIWFSDLLRPVVEHFLGPRP
ncbi:hypothetical protein [Methylorubrum extorquens]